MRRVLRTSLVALSLVLSSSAVADPPQRPSKSLAAREPDEARVERILQSLSPREKVGQLLLAYPQVGKENPVEVGGVLFVGGTLKKLEAAKERIRSSRERARIPPFFAVDIEGGNFNRLSRHQALKDLPLARDMAQMEDAEVEAWGVRVGKAMREVGLNMNLAPVFDVSPKGHMFRNGRAFSGDPEVVKRKATAFARGLAKAGVVSIGKHFPGYGDLDTDSDHEHAVADWDEQRVRLEAAAFRAADRYLGGVMMSNIVYAKLGPGPAILEPALVAMAHENGWISVTDDVAIRALAEQIGAEREEVVRRAFLAGNDLILTTEPPDWSGGLDYFGILTKLAESDPKMAEHLDASVRRVLRLKDRMGLLDGL
jgi:beta-N-acetylhexosaminidase